MQLPYCPQVGLKIINDRILADSAFSILPNKAVNLLVLSNACCFRKIGSSVDIHV